MGLCTCPKKKVTNQFCFEHRVNVCEHCMVEEHPACIVQSYLQWLDDSEYNPVCRICNQGLVDDECIRLVCYDVFHKKCMLEWAGRLPANTAPAGYKCPVCGQPVFPAANLVSPVADCVREVLAPYPWARTGLGLPLIEGESKSQSNWSLSNGSVVGESESSQGHPATPTRPLTPSTASATDTTHPRPHSQGNSINTSNSGLRVTAMEDPALTHSQHRDPHHHHPYATTTTTTTTTATPPDSPSVGRKTSTASDTRLLLPTQPDVDDGDNKYKRRSAVEWFSRWWRTMNRPASRHHQRLTPGVRRMAVLLVVMAVITIVVVLSYFSRGASDSDPMLDPFNNPNIHVEGQAGER